MSEPGTFTCADCGGTWEKAWSDEQADEERKENGWGDVVDVVLVCDDCFVKYTRH